ncbi:GyrI-like domain-containing protein [Lactococcus garvieae]|uniref:GyrI-like domain-containing protein n=1 Tax=Lactococcus garvieae TaxID=1363 RepID=UPI0009BE621D|nr:GyrI-like domain-containing protein [Lactococcus garvieae]
MTKPIKIDFKKTEKEYYYPKKIEIITVPEMTYLTVSGEGDPAGEAFQKAIGLLYPIAYTISMSYKKEDYKIPGFYNFVIPPLEGLWTSKEAPKEGQVLNKEELIWKIMLRMPDFVTEEVVDWAKHEATLKKREDFSSVTYEKIADGLCVQAIHIGPFAEEATTFTQMEEFAEAEGLALIHKTYHHREIYLSDFRKTVPEKLKTVLRQYAVVKDNYEVKK